MLSTGQEATEEQVKSARKHVADGFRRNCEMKLNGEWGYASHVTQNEIEVFASADLVKAREVEQGLHDGRFWCWQRMNYFITGVSVPFLPPPK